MTFIGREPVKIVAEVIKNQLGLDEQHVVLGEEKFDIPTDNGLFVALFDDGPTPIAASNRFDTATNEEVQTLEMLHPIRIEVMSFGPDARTRKEEVHMALASLFAQLLADKYQVQIAPQASRFTDASAAEGSGILRRYSTTVNVTALHAKVQPAGYYDKFNGATVDQTAKPPEVLENV